MARPELSGHAMIEEQLSDLGSDEIIVSPDVVIKVAELGRNWSEDQIKRERDKWGKETLRIARYSLGIRDVYDGYVIGRDDWSTTDPNTGEQVDDFDALEVFDMRPGNLPSGIDLGSGSSKAYISFYLIPSVGKYIAKFHEGTRGPSRFYKGMFDAAVAGTLLDISNDDKHMFWENATTPQLNNIAPRY